LVHGGREAVEAILDHEAVDAVSFVGQASTARLIATRSAQTGKRVQALGGAKNSMIVAEDADLDSAVPAIMGSAFGAAGQRCLAGSVCVIAGDEARQAEVRDALKSAAQVLSTGPGADPGTDVCPMVAPESRERAEAAVAKAESDGATVLLDGRQGGGEAGTVLGATLVEVSDPESARAYRWGIEAGMLGVNIGVPAPVAWFPFSGWKDSIDGDLHANGKDAVDFYTRKKVVTSRW
jgi:malonate-semialdehyde dehydrogenase (acetylating)/methylmalonate-semialdehyde dehydrogenase